MPLTTFPLKEEYIHLIQLLKFTGIAESGAHASELVLSHMVFCNEELETRKRYKVKRGDKIRVDDQVIEVI